MHLFPLISKSKYIIISRRKSFKLFRFRKMGQVIPEFNQNNGDGAMDDQLNLDNEN